jgi:hypothetical protein
LGKKQKIAFLFLDEIHHVNHFISIAVELSKNHQVSILTYPDKHEYLVDKLKSLEGDAVKIERLKTHPFRALTDALKKRKQPRKGFWFKQNQKYILSKFDALVFTDYIHHKLLKYRGNNSSPKFIKIPHGLAGRAYCYKKDLLDYDLHLIFGSWYLEQLENRNLLGNKTVVIGYPKLDAVKKVTLPKLFNNDKPIVIYNPHFTPEVSSWHKDGIKVLDFFNSQNDYNLIFAPHINLFNKVGGETETDFLETYKNNKNIFIDTGSVACVEMTYIKLADLYLGDVSSQVSEFIITPRSCVFINTHNVSYKDNPDYPSWQAGEVINDISLLNETLAKASKNFDQYKEIQIDLTQKNFDQTGKESPSIRGALEILKLVYTSI